MTAPALELPQLVDVGPALELLDAELATARARLASAQAQVDALEIHVAQLRDLQGPKIAGAAEPASAPSSTAAPATPTPSTSDDDRFRCACGKVCANGTGLAAHKRHCDVAKKRPTTEVAKPTECPDCGEGFPNGAALSSHRRKAGHWGESPD
ncbi:MAG: hypothetical protein AAGA90_07795 [Actinomycetota bacterium]